MSDFKQLLSTNLDTLNNQQLFSLIEGLENSILIKKHNGKYDADLNTQVKLLKNHLQEACKFYLINRFGNSDIIIKMNLLFPSYKKLSIAPSSGELILFPSYLPHETTKFKSSEERICIAFNLIDARK